MLEAEALPLALLGNVAAEHPGASRLARWPLPGPTGVQQMGLDRKGRAPYHDDRRDLPQLGTGATSPVI